MISLSPSLTAVSLAVTLPSPLGGIVLCFSNMGRCMLAPSSVNRHLVRALGRGLVNVTSTSYSSPTFTDSGALISKSGL